MKKISTIILTAIMSMGLMVGCGKAEKVPVDSLVEFQGKKHFKTIDGKLFSGLAYSSDANGKIKSTEEYKDGVLDGESIKYDSAGQVERLLTFRKGVTHGKCHFVTTYENNTIMDIYGNLNNDKREGEWRGVSRNTKLPVMGGKYSNGKAIGFWRIYHENLLYSWEEGTFAKESDEFDLSARNGWKGFYYKDGWKLCPLDLGTLSSSTRRGALLN